MRHVPAVRIGSADVAVGTRKRDVVSWSQSIPVRLEPDELSEVLTTLWRDSGLGVPSGAEVYLERSVAQLRELHDLPPLSAGDLQRLVENQHERFFRPPREPVAISAAWIDRPSGHGRAAMVPLRLLTCLEEALHACGSTVRCFKVVDARGALVPSLRFRTDAMRRRRRRRLSVMRSLAALAVACSWSVAVLGYWLDLRADATHVEEALAELEEPLRRLTLIERSLGSFVPVSEAIHRQRAGDRWLANVLASLDGALPDSAYLVRLEADRDGALQADVRAPDAVNAFNAISSAFGGSGRLLEEPVAEEHAGRAYERFSVRLEAPR